MQFKIPRNSEKYQWTQHSIYKLKQHGLSAQRILRVIRAPQRKEEGIVKNTIAVMQPTSVRTMKGKKVWSSEIWAMYQVKGKNDGRKFSALKLKIISAWRYPGMSPKSNPVPDEILLEITDLA